MRILVIANLPPWVLGGAENQVARLVDDWIALGHHVEVAGHRIPNGHAELSRCTIPVHQIKVAEGLGRGGRAATYLISLAILLSRIKHDFDVIYSRGIGDGAISICLLKALGWVKLPLVACPMGSGKTGDAKHITSIPYWRKVVCVINRHCEAINLIAPAIEADLTGIGITGPHKSHIPNGIVIAPSVNRNDVAPIRRLIWTGRLSWGKGLDLLILTFTRIVASGRDFRLEIVGDGPDRSILSARCCELGLDSRVTFAGSVHRNQIRERLATADAFILPSHYEGMSNSALEAMEAGLPVLLTRCGGIDTYVDEGLGWVCEPGDPDSLFTALCRLLDAPDDKLLAMGRRARRLVEREFDMRSVASRNAALLAELVSTSAG